MAINDPATKAYVGKLVAAAVSSLKADQAKALTRLPRHDEFSLTNIAVGTVEQDVSWLVPIDGDYTVVVAPTTGAAAVGFVSATVKAGSKTPIGCTVIVSNRGPGSVAAAAFDVLAFPL